jgi:hypothetical protein
MDLESIQSELQNAGLDGWLLFDHHERDPLAYRVLGLKSPGPVSRRWYYFIPARGEARGLVHQVEPHVLNPLPGARIPDARGQEQEAGLRKLLQGAKTVLEQLEEEPEHHARLVKEDDFTGLQPGADLVGALGVGVAGGVEDRKAQQKCPRAGRRGGAGRRRHRRDRWRGPVARTALRRRDSSWRRSVRGERPRSGGPVAGSDGAE